MQGAPCPPAAPALFDGLLLAESAVEAARWASRAWWGDLAGPLLVPADATEAMQEQLAPGDHGLRVALVTRPTSDDPLGLDALRAARGRLLDDDRVELTGVHVPLPDPRALDPLLAGLDLSVPAWIEIPPDDGWQAAVEGVAADGAENLAVRLPPDAVAPGPDSARPVAALVRRAVDLDLRVRVTGAGGGAATTTRLLAALAAVRVALDGGSEAQVAAALAERDRDVLVAAALGTSAADAGRVRKVVDGVVVLDAEQTASELASMRLVEPAH